MMRRTRTACLLGAMSAAFLAMGCNDNGYRTNIYPGEEGNYTVQRVPEETSPGDAANSHVHTDKDLAEVETLWPQLTPDDRKTVTDLVRRLAVQKP